MKEEGLIDNKTITVIAANSLEIVAAKKMKFVAAGDIKETLNNLRNKTLLIIGDPVSTGLGESTREALQKLKMWPVFEKLTVRAPTSSKAIDLIIKGESAGIVYKTDALLYNEKVDNLGDIPTSLHEPIDYYAAVVVGDNMERAREALKFLKTKPAKEIFKSNGFVVR